MERPQLLLLRAGLPGLLKKWGTTKASPAKATPRGRHSLPPHAAPSHLVACLSGRLFLAESGGAWENLDHIFIVRCLGRIVAGRSLPAQEQYRGIMILNEKDRSIAKSDVLPCKPTGKGSCLNASVVQPTIGHNTANTDMAIC